MVEQTGIDHAMLILNLHLFFAPAPISLTDPVAKRSDPVFITSERPKNPVMYDPLQSQPLDALAVLLL
jgi:hypothetical protein